MKRLGAAQVWLILLGLQAIASLLLFGPFLSGRYYFAYIDIGSDTLGQLVPTAMHLARSIATLDLSGWSFQVGLGGPTAWMYNDPFQWLSALGGPQGVLASRIWIYLLKIVLGGGAFFLLVRCYTVRWEVAVITALSYSFCGYMATNGQWDPEANGLIFFPLILWAIERSLRSSALASVVAVPVTVALALIGGVFFVTLFVFVLLVALAYIVISPQRSETTRCWRRQVLPQALLGVLLAAPFVLPVILQMLDSPRVIGGQSLVASLWHQAIGLNPWSLILLQIGGLFHKDLFGIGNYHQGWGNYFEGPEFFVGMLSLLAIAQLWGRSRYDRKLLILGLVAVLAYWVFPVIRLATVGFAAPYFRASLLWPTLVLLLLAARGMDHMLERGVNERLLAAGVTAIGLLLSLVFTHEIRVGVQRDHLMKIVALSVGSAAVLWIAARGWLPARVLPWTLVGIVLLEVVLVVRPSYTDGRQIVQPDQAPFSDATQQALAVIRAQDSGVFRVEKDFLTVSYADSLAQDFMGVRSYHFHGQAVVSFHVATGLIPPVAPASTPNYTNWLPGPGSRVALDSVLGVKYRITQRPIARPGLTLLHQGRDFWIYRNDLALPLGFVQSQKISSALFAGLASKPSALAEWYQDLTLINAAVVRPGDGANLATFELDRLLGETSLNLDTWYRAPALALQKTGLRISDFRSNLVAGTIHPSQPGLLVFSIPYNAGWTLRVDDQPVPLIQANFGMLAAPVTAGEHKVELRFQLPGRRSGLLLGALGLGLLVLLCSKQHRGRSAPPGRPPLTAHTP